MRRALVIVGKAPRPGTSKTRLVPPLTAEEAAELSRAFLLDTVALGLSLDWECVYVVHPHGDGEVLEALLPAPVRCVAQEGTGLGDALRGAFERCFGEGYERVVLIDSDSPTLPAAVVAEGSEALHTVDVTAGPATDGGYYLLGMGTPHPELFDGIDWSTPRVLEQTLQRARGLRVKTLREWYDVDTPADLARLQADLDHAPGGAAETRKVLGHLKLSVAR